MIAVMKKFTTSISVRLISVVALVALLVYMLNFTSNSKHIFSILVGHKTNFNFEVDGYRDMDNCKFRDKLNQNKPYFQNLSDGLSKQGIRLLVSEDLLHSNECEEGITYGIWVSGINDPFDVRIFLIKHWVTLGGIQYILEPDEYTKADFKQTIELKQLL